MIWYQWIALLWMASVVVVCGGHVMVQMLRALREQEDVERVSPQFLILAVSGVFTAMAFYGVQW